MTGHCSDIEHKFIGCISSHHGITSIIVMSDDVTICTADELMDTAFDPEPYVMEYREVYLDEDHPIHHEFPLNKIEHMFEHVFIPSGEHGIIRIRSPGDSDHTIMTEDRTAMNAVWFFHVWTYQTARITGTFPISHVNN